VVCLGHGWGVWVWVLESNECSRHNTTIRVERSPWVSRNAWIHWL
jgi:hypothetical protein